MFGCIFDCDGVIVDSSALHIEAWKLLAGEEGLVFPEHLFKKSFGMKNEQIIPQLFGWTADMKEIKRLDQRKELLYRNLVGSRGASTFPGVEPFLNLLHDQRIPCVVGSSAPRANVTVALETLGFGMYFRAIISGEDAALGKPDPQIFLAGARAMEMAPGQCVVFEDAHVGIAAARAGGMKVVAVANTFPRVSLQEADCVVDRLDELTLVGLKKLLASGSTTRRPFP
jgi:HAD superfamily hydrolase (TIGR01509 family)